MELAMRACSDAATDGAEVPGASGSNLFIGVASQSAKILCYLASERTHRIHDPNSFSQEFFVAAYKIQKKHLERRSSGRRWLNGCEKAADHGIDQQWHVP